MYQGYRVNRNSATPFIQFKHVLGYSRMMYLPVVSNSQWSSGVWHASPWHGAGVQGSMDPNLGQVGQFPCSSQFFPLLPPVVDSRPGVGGKIRIIIIPAVVFETCPTLYVALHIILRIHVCVLALQIYQPLAIL